jgi:hypothetical protein
MAVICKHGNKLYSSMKGGELLDQLSAYQLLEKNSASQFNVTISTA